MSFIEIRIINRFDPSRADWFQGLNIEPISLDETRLSGEVPDRSAIYGILAGLSSLGLTLISVDVTDQDHDDHWKTTHLSN